ncbi:MAG: helix-hairpin-helix domain-containing protein [Bacteroidetes bacterium]|nr:helix-hairpin-helix domain-containing protein [Bacteroidota bacterium]
MRIKRIIHRHLTFSRSERWMLIYFAVIILAIFISKNFIVDLFTRRDREASLKEHQELVAQILHIKDSLSIVYNEVNFEEELENESALFKFNPNTIDYATWIELRISEKVASIIINYVNKGGKFYSANDLLKVYGFKAEYLERLQPYIVFENSESISKTIIRKDEIDYFIFDPNQILINDWVQLGIHYSIAERIVNYLSKGGHFYQVDDLKKIYGFKEDDFERLKSYMVIAERNPEENLAKELATGEISTNEINAFTKNDLMILGFTSKVADNFINYRSKLGGFYSKQQLLEIWDINKEMAESVFQKYSLDTINIKHIRMNSASEEELKNHPYISDELAEAIILYRNKTGKFYSITEIFKAGYVSKKTFEKLAHYLQL